MTPMLAAALETLLEAAREAGREGARQALAEGRSADHQSAAEWLTQAAAGRLAGVAPQTIRAWQAAGRLSKGLRGRVNAAELRRFLAEGGAAPVPGGVPELRQERAKRAAQELLDQMRRRGGG